MAEPPVEVPQWLFCGEPLDDAELAELAQDVDGACNCISCTLKRFVT